jgi:riboflavin transporter FmnP
MESRAILAISGGVLAGLAMNFIPTIIAYARRHPERRLIGQLNILSILSFLLWVALIAWAAGGARDDSVIAKFVGAPGQRQKLVALVVVLVGAGVASTAYALSLQ